MMILESSFIIIPLTQQPLTVFLLFPTLQRDASGQPDQIVKNMPEMANLVYNMYMHMIQTSQKYRQVTVQTLLFMTIQCRKLSLFLYFITFKVQHSK